MSAESIWQILCIYYWIILTLLVIHTIAHCNALILAVNNGAVVMPLSHDTGVHQ